MSDVEAKSKREAKADSPAAVWSPDPAPRETPRRRLRIRPFVITLATIAVAGVLVGAMWNAYMGAPWTRDGTVRAYVVTMAVEVSGYIVELPVADNQFVHKGDLLMVIDPTDYKIAVSLNEAAVQQAQANALNAERESKRRQELTTLAVTVEEKTNLREQCGCRSGTISAGGGQAGASARQSAADRNSLSGQRL